MAVYDAVSKFFIPFVVWTVTSFFCHKCAKEFLITAEPGFTSSSDMTSSALRCGLALILTFAQCIVCLMTVSPATDLPGNALYVTMATHFLATLATNLSMGFIHAASTFAIKLTEPVTMVIAHRLAFSTPISMETWFSLPLIITGAFIFTDAAFSESTMLGVSLALASNIILAARNVSMKKIQEKNVPPKSEVDGQTAPKPKKVIHLRDKKVMAIGYSLLAAAVMFYFFLHKDGRITVLKPYTLMVLLGSAVFHVSYSYISTNLVLRVMTVVSHSVANIFKRLLVVLLLYAGGHRSATAGSWAGLGLSAVGLGIYIFPQIKQSANSGNYVGGGSGRAMLKRVSFLVVGLVLCVVTVTTFTNVKTMSVKIFNLQAQLMNYKSEQQETPAFIVGNSSSLPSTIFNDSNIVDSNLVDFNTWQKAAKARKPPSDIIKSNEDFLSKRLVNYPTDTDFLAKQLKDTREIVEETQRIHMSVLRDLIGNARHVMMMEIATYENKGDPAITVGQTLLFRKLNLTMVYYCSTWKCTKTAMEHAQKIGKKYAKDDLVIFMQGGGNLVGYHSADFIRERVLNAFPDRLKIMFSQSIWLTKTNQKDLKDCTRIYSNRSNLVMYSRDRQTLGIAMENFKGTRHMLMPDMVFNIGMVPRQFPPSFDVLWLKRGDGESPKYETKDVLKNVNFTYHVSDYYGNWPSNKGATELETSFIIASTGLQFLQRGRVLITDRLHGHILSSLLDIPHVLFDNPPFHKLSMFHKSWTASQNNVVIVDNKEQAVMAAQMLLKRYDAVLPKIGPYMSKDIWEH